MIRYPEKFDFHPFEFNIINKVSFDKQLYYQVNIYKNNDFISSDTLYFGHFDPNSNIFITIDMFKKILYIFTRSELPTWWTLSINLLHYTYIVVTQKYITIYLQYNLYHATVYTVDNVVVDYYTTTVVRAKKGAKCIYLSDHTILVK